MKEQQVQRYEATDYAGASLERLSKVINALGLHVREDVLLPGAGGSLEEVFDVLRDLVDQTVSAHQGSSR